MRCDLHVHSTASGMCTVPLARYFCRESYNEPLALYETLKRRGMDLVTVSDHDSIDAAEALRHYPDFFLSEEVSCTLPSGNGVHVGVYDITERDHIELQRRRDDVPALAAYCRERDLLYAVNHVFSGLTGSRALADFGVFEEWFPAIETLNGHIPSASNSEADSLAALWRKIPLGGSDSHTLAELGRAFTEAPGARNKQEFLCALKAGHCRARGFSGSARVLTTAVCTIAWNVPKEHAWSLLLTPLMLAVPFATAGTTVRDWFFTARWRRRAGFPSHPICAASPAPALPDSL